MLDDRGFDRWADGYDGSAGASDRDGTYPFAGYGRILGSIFRRIMEKPGAAVLDLGFGTGALTARLYEGGCAVYGQDFSPRMIGLASEKMPGARLYRGDLSLGLAEPLKRESYDFIVATYSLHHLTDERKISLLTELLGLLREDGRILIGDVAFGTRAELERCREESGDEWDDDEIYCVADELRRPFPDLTFEKVTFCSGILTLSRKDGKGYGGDA